MWRIRCSRPWAAWNPGWLCSLSAGFATLSSPTSKQGQKLPVTLRYIYVWFKIRSCCTAGDTKVQREGRKGQAALGMCPRRRPDENELERPFLGITQQPAFPHWTLNTDKQPSPSNGVPDGETLPGPLSSAPSLNAEWNQLRGKAEGDPAMALEIPSKENKWSAWVTGAHRSQR